ncbi:ribosome assembly RNA-binding protein YhbY [Alicyclobacillus macrosporangiidus]|uniref:ribosome assembly RNA-binding protein YhbY n=1 Tax=Alicyclobacillus macrosporangiidus TaxID=392015 RepID=UPI0009E00575|nr:ribosome assembly RNA-binding protein YhbY [Alicyclobacillus macrosporangiidus]
MRKEELMAGQTLTGKQIRALRALAHHLRPVVQVGKAGVTAGVIEQVEEVLDAQELIKVSVLDTSPLERDEVGDILVEETGASWVQSIGRTVVLYRRNKENPQIELPSP